MPTNHRPYPTTFFSMKTTTQKIDNGNWDNLIILDCCRNDYFQELANNFFNIKGSNQKIKAPHTRTIDFLNDALTEIDGTCYSGWHKLGKGNNANYLGEEKEPYYIDQNFTHVKESFQNIYEKNRQTVHPEKLTDKYINQLEEGENKRVFWYTQPRKPYIGTIKMDFKEEYGGIYRYLNIEKPAEQSFFIKTWRKAYRANLILVLQHVSRLVHELEGRTVITSNHGEALGENNVYGHFEKTEEVEKVPWFKIEGTQPPPTNKKQFIKQAFKTILGREASEKDVETYKDENRDRILSVLLKSQEYLDKRSSEFSHIPVKDMTADLEHTY